MAVDGFSRVLAYAALAAAEQGGGGSSSKGIDNVYIRDGHLHIVYSNGDDIDIGQVVGAPGRDGKVYVPSIDKDTKVLSWTIEDREGVIPDPIDLGDESEWKPVEGDDPEEEYEWGEI